MKRLIFIVVFFLVSVISFSQTYSNVDSIEVNYITVYKSVCYEGDGYFSTYKKNELHNVLNHQGFVKFEFNEYNTKANVDEKTISELHKIGVPALIHLGEYNVRNLPKVIIFYMENKYKNAVSVIIYQKETKSIWCNTLDF